MSTLVAYDSSSEDEGPIPKGDRSSIEAPVPAQENSVDARLKKQDESEDRPMVGPYIPSEAMQGYDEMDDNDGVGTGLEMPSSERDMVRYLTQATHPMTEMPPSPPGSPNASTTAKFKHFLALKAEGIHFNEDLATKSAFRNPSLLSTLLERAGLDSQDVRSTSLSTDVFHAGSLPKIGYKEALLKSQQNVQNKKDQERKALAATGKRVVEFTSGGQSRASDTMPSPSGLHKRPRQ